MSEASETGALLTALKNAEAAKQWEEVDRLYWQLAETTERTAEIIAKHAIAVEHTGDTARAATMTRKALRLDPQNIDYYVQLGKLYLRLEWNTDAEKCLRKAHEIEPDDFEVLRRLAQSIQHTPEQRPEAEQLLRHAMEIHGDHTALWQQLGAVVANDSRRHAEAEHAFRRALDLLPGVPSTLHNLGLLCRQQGRLDEAEQYLLQAFEADPGNSGFAFSLGLCYYYMENMDKALEWCRKAVALDQKNTAARVYCAFCLFMLGKMREGWEEYEKRLKLTELKFLNYSRPRWDGTPLNGERILLIAEQGLGDNMQFVRYAEMVAERGGEVILVAMDAQERLFKTVNGVSMVLPGVTAPKYFHRFISLMSLPFVFGTTEETVPANVPYVHSQPEDVEKWKPRILSRPGFRVGIAWRGNPQHVNDFFRSSSLEEMAQLLRIEGTAFFSLMKTRPEFEQDLPDGLEDIGSEFEDFADAAGAYDLLDLIISVDSAPCHLAGALGRPVWTMLPRGSDFRWGLTGDTSPWYPTMKLYRQNTLGDWSVVYDEMTRDLKAEIARNASA